MAIQVTDTAFRGGGMTMTFSDGSVAECRIQLVDGILSLTGLNDEQLAAAIAMQTNANHSCEADPRLSNMLIKRGVFAALESSANTTIVSAGTYYPINGTFSNSPMESFDFVSGPAIRYTNTYAFYAEIDWHATIVVVPGNANVIVGIKKNGVLIPSSRMGTFAAAILIQMSGTVVVQLQHHDTIQLVVTSDADGDVVTFHSFTTTIRNFFG